MDYFDASVLVSVLFAEPLSVHVDQHIARATQPLIVSDFGTAEVSSSVSRLVRTNRLDLDQGAALLAEFDNWRADVCEPLETITEDIAAAIHIVRRFELMIRIPDAINLAICHRIGARMITLDRRLHTAAQMVGVPALDPAEA